MAFSSSHQSILMVGLHEGSFGFLVQDGCRLVLIDMFAGWCCATGTWGLSTAPTWRLVGFSAMSVGSFVFVEVV